MESNLGLVLETRDEFAEAETHFRAALEICERRADGADGPLADRTSQCERNLGRVLLRRSRFAEAEAFLVRRSAATDQRGYPDRVGLLIELYDAWELAEPGRGHGEAAREWRTKLAALAAK
jgi:hypothetical protein